MNIIRKVVFDNSDEILNLIKNLKSGNNFKGNMFLLSNYIEDNIKYNFIEKSYLGVMELHNNKDYMTFQPLSEKENFMIFWYEKNKDKLCEINLNDLSIRSFFKKEIENDIILFIKSIMRKYKIENILNNN